MSLREAAIAANRFGLGATPGLINEIKSDPRGWLKEQLVPETSLPAPLAALPPTGEDQMAFGYLTGLARRGGDAGRQELGRLIAEARRELGVERQGGGMDGGGMEAGGMEAGGSMEEENPAEAGGGTAFYAVLINRYQKAVKARFDTAVQSETPFRERLVHFWSNHFVVSGAKASAIAHPPSFERDVARAHVAGKFVDMLMASSKHPAMLFYLDNAFSIGPNSKWGQDPELVPFVSPVIGRPEGLNENLAREILELHTVGVNGGYTQDDVRNFAKVITGWGYNLRRNTELSMDEIRQMSAADLFYFNPDAHEPGPQTVMGRVYESDGVEKGEAVLRDLATYPQTANFVAGKLVRFFVSDTPPEAAVERVARRFLDSGGDLPETVRALIDSPEAWDQELPKIKQPEEYLISAVRAMGGPEMSRQELNRVLNQMGQRPYMQGGPDGWPDVASSWSGPDALWKRLEWAVIAANDTATADMDPADLASAVLGPTLTSKTVRSIRGAESPAQGKALMLVSPEFLRR